MRMIANRFAPKHRSMVSKFNRVSKDVRNKPHQTGRPFQYLVMQKGGKPKFSVWHVYGKPVQLRVMNGLGSHHNFEWSTQVQKFCERNQIPFIDFDAEGQSSRVGYKEFSGEIFSPRYASKV